MRCRHPLHRGQDPRGLESGGGERALLLRDCPAAALHMGSPSQQSFHASALGEEVHGHPNPYCQSDAKVLASRLSVSPPRRAMAVDSNLADFSGTPRHLAHRARTRDEVLKSGAATPRGRSAQSACLGSAPARLLRLLRARLAALSSAALPGRGRPTGRPATASGARANRLQVAHFTALDRSGAGDEVSRAASTNIGAAKTALASITRELSKANVPPPTGEPKEAPTGITFLTKPTSP